MEFRKIVAVLGKLFGSENIEAAEDIASETFLKALETWPYTGIPENPAAWLYAVAKNKARNFLQRNKTFHDKISASIPPGDPVEQEEVDLSEKNISDSQLQMLFTICHPSIPAESQVALALRILCGFSTEEIANAFLSNKETISKRLFRGKEKLRLEKIPVAFPGEKETGARLETALRTLYLLFNEGYYSESQDAVVRQDLCHEAMRLTYLLTEYEGTNKPGVNALLALMCFHASRLPARKNERGDIILYEDQDEHLWDQTLIEKGAYYLNQAAQGDRISKYHLEAAIAYWHTRKEDTREKWENILQLYNQLLKIEYSPIAALNRTFALSKTNGKEEAVREANKLQLSENRYYHVLLGELLGSDDKTAAQRHFETALTLARTKPEREIIQKKIDALASTGSSPTTGDADQTQTS